MWPTVGASLAASTFRRSTPSSTWVLHDAPLQAVRLHYLQSPRGQGRLLRLLLLGVSAEAEAMSITVIAGDWHPYDRCICGCGEIHQKAKKNGHVVGCKCKPCIGTRS